MFIKKEISRFPFQVLATPTRTLIKAKFDYHSLSCFVQRVFYLVEYLLLIPTIFLLSPNTPQCIGSNAPLILATSCDFFYWWSSYKNKHFFPGRHKYHKEDLSIHASSKNIWCWNNFLLPKSAYRVNHVNIHRWYWLKQIICPFCSTIKM